MLGKTAVPIADDRSPAPGAIAQLGERVLCKHEVVGSIPSGSTKPDDGGRTPENGWGMAPGADILPDAILISFVERVSALA
jgi:hypothetical protein